MKEFHTCVGIDLARRSNHKAVIVPNNGRSPHSMPKKAFSFSHSLEGFESLCQWVRKQTGGESLEGVVVNMEPASGVWELVACFLKSRGADAYFTPPDVVSQLRKVQSKFAKTDRIDAATLLGMPFSLCERMVPVVHIEKRIRALRMLSSQRLRFVEEATRWKNRFTCDVEHVWGQLLAGLKDAQRFCTLTRAFFTRFSDPRKVVRYGRQRFERWCAQNAHGNTDMELVETLWEGAMKAAQLVNELERCGAIEFDWQSYGEKVAQDLRAISYAEGEVALLDQRIKEARKDVPECDLLEQLPGVGKVTAVTLAAIVMPVSRFANAKKCGAYTGFTSRQKSSAEREIEGLKITKRGNRRLKRVLALAADTAMRVDPELAQVAIRMLKAGKHYNKVRVAVGRKIAVRAYSFLKRFDASKNNVLYIWRDLQGNPVTKKQAKAIADALWAMHKAKQKHKKGNSPNSANRGRRKDAIKRLQGESPGSHSMAKQHHRSNSNQAA